MSPTRRHMFTVLAGAALAPVAASAASTPPTDLEAMIAARDALLDIAQMPGADP